MENDLSHAYRQRHKHRQFVQKIYPHKKQQSQQTHAAVAFLLYLIKILNRIDFLFKNICTCSKLISYDYPPVVDIYQQRRIFRHSAERPAWRKTDREIS